MRTQPGPGWAGEGDLTLRQLGLEAGQVSEVRGGEVIPSAVEVGAGQPDVRLLPRHQPHQLLVPLDEHALPRRHPGKVYLYEVLDRPALTDQPPEEGVKARPEIDHLDRGVGGLEELLYKGGHARHPGVVAKVDLRSSPLPPMRPAKSDHCVT